MKPTWLQLELRVDYKPFIHILYYNILHAINNWGLPTDFYLYMHFISKLQRNIIKIQALNLMTSCCIISSDFGAVITDSQHHLYQLASKSPWHYFVFFIAYVQAAPVISVQPLIL